MNKCPICTKSFPPVNLEQHISNCISLPYTRSPHKFFPNSQQSKSIPSKPNHNQESKTEKIEKIESEDRKKALTNEICRLKLCLKRIVDIVKCSNRSEYLQCEKVYNTLTLDLHTFLRKFGEFREKLKVIEKRGSLEKAEDVIRNKNVVVERGHSNNNRISLTEFSAFEGKNKIKNGKKPQNNDKNSLNSVNNVSKPVKNDLNEVKRKKEALSTEKREQMMAKESRKMSVKEMVNQFYKSDKPLLDEINQTHDKKFKDNYSPTFFENWDFNGVVEDENAQDLQMQRKANFESVTSKIEEKISNSDEETLSGRNPHICGICEKKMVEDLLTEGEICGHKICHFCINEILIDRINNKFYEKESLTCLKSNCNKEFPHGLINSILPRELFDLFSEQQITYLKTSDDSLVSCPKCGFTFYRESGCPKDLEGTKNSQGNDLSTELKSEMSANRFRCSSCHIEFCAVCKSHPYHKGKTCDQFSQYLRADKCRFCKKALEGYVKGKKAICSNAECIVKASNSCWKENDCGHFCIGTSGHKKCIKCIHKDCKKTPEGIDSNDFCQICYTESLDSAPCVRLGCGHLFHSECIGTKLSKKWPAARITFGYLSCPLCNKTIDSVDNPHLQQFVLREKELYNEIREKSFNRIEIEGFQNDEKLRNPESSYYGKPYEYALHKFAYYICSKCGKSYFGGMRNCEEAIKELSHKFDKNELVCGSCSTGGNAKRCKTHGTEFLTFKCKFCCNVANWFCWGKTHFCDKCHTEQVDGMNVAKKKKHQLEKCKGRNLCPLKVDHPPNGKEYCLGCVVCLRK